MKLMEIANIRNKIYHGDIDVSDYTIKSIYDINKIEEYKDYEPNCYVDGNFIVSDQNIVSLEGSPNVVYRNFSCTNTKITSLVGGPEKVGGIMYASRCDKLKSLNGLPNKIGESLYLLGVNDHLNIRALWECQIKNINIRSNSDSNTNLEDAVDLMMKYKLVGSKNYMEVMREARELGLEDFFK